jgi:pyrimidine-specific ribonucleoside hydrolase
MMNLNHTFENRQKTWFRRWKAVVLTNELHHHMGHWSIVGAKMGIRAREILAAPLDNI